MGSELPTELPRSAILLFACPFLMFTQIRPFKVLLENRVAGFLGLTSYSIYLWQLPIIQELEKLGFAADLVTLTVIVVVISAISYVAVERPFLTWFRAGHKQPQAARSKPVAPKQASLAEARR